MAQAAFFAPRPAGDPTWGEWFTDHDTAQIGYHSKDGSTAYADPTLSPRGDALAFAQDAPGKRADGVYVWSLRRGCTGTARRVAAGGLDPDFGPAGF